MTHWCLVRMVSKEPGVKDHHSLAYIRDLQAGEKKEIDEAQKLLRSFSANWQGDIAALSLRRFDEVFEESVVSMQKASGCLNDSDRSMLSRATVEAARDISSWPRKILDGEYENLGSTSGDREIIANSAKKLLSEGSLLLALEYIAAVRDDSLVSVVAVEKDGKRQIVAHFRKEILQAAGVPDADNWIVQELLSMGISQLQHLAATILKTYRQQIESSSRIILSIYAEVLYGYPVLIQKDRLTTLGERGDLSYTPVEKPNIEGILRAVDTADGLLGPTVKQKVEPATPTAAKVAPVKPKAAENRANIPNEASDLGMLLAYVSSLSTDLEKHWSSLVLNSGNEPQKETLNKWHSFLSSLKSRIEKQNRDVGSDLSLTVRFPMVAADLMPSTEVPQIESTLKQVTIAEMHSLRNLANVMQGLQRPTAVQIDLISGNEIHWWESGAFNLVRRSAEVALRIVHRRDQVIELHGSQDSNPLGLETPSAATHMMLYLSLTRTAMDQGLPEASLLYCSMVLRGIAIRLGVQPDSAEQVASVISSELHGELRGPTEQVFTLVRDLAHGKDMPVEQVFNLANFWYAAIGELVEGALMYKPATHEESAES